MIFLISIGLYEKENMSIKAMETAKKCDKLYIERYTSYYKTTNEELEKYLGKKIEQLTREEFEDGRKIIEEGKTKNVGVLVIGDALSATTHTALILEARKKGIKTEIIHGSSILTAIAETGLIIYNFGKTTSIVFHNENIVEPYNTIKKNKNLHTLALLDMDNEKNKYMTTQEAINYLLRVEEKKKEGVFTEDTKVVLIAAMGGEQEMRFGKVSEMKKVTLKGVPQSLIVVGKLHFMEEEFLETLNKKLK
ncbi:MAG: diphthine synthase [archaeon]